MLKLRHHKGHSGKSVYAWRVYRIHHDGSQTQLAKYRTEADALKALRFYEEREQTLVAQRTGDER